MVSILIRCIIDETDYWHNKQANTKYLSVQNDPEFCFYSSKRRILQSRNSVINWILLLRANQSIVSYIQVFVFSVTNKLRGSWGNPGHGVNPARGIPKEPCGQRKISMLPSSV